MRACMLMCAREYMCMCMGDCSHPGGTAIPREPPDDPIALRTDPTASGDTGSRGSV